MCVQPERANLSSKGAMDPFSHDFHVFRLSVTKSKSGHNAVF